MTYNPDIINQIDLLTKTFLNPYNIITSVTLASSTVGSLFGCYFYSKKKVEQGKQLKGLAKTLFSDELEYKDKK
jgi:hypothetical protein